MHVRPNIREAAAAHVGRCVSPAVSDWQVTWLLPVSVESRPLASTTSDSHPAHLHTSLQHTKQQRLQELSQYSQECHDPGDSTSLYLYGFLLVSYNNHNSKIHRFWAIDMGQTEGRTTASLNHPCWWWSITEMKARTSVLIVGPKCTLATSHAAFRWVTVSMLAGQTDRQTLSAIDAASVITHNEFYNRHHITLKSPSPTVWNSLPDFIRDPTISAYCFRRLLITYLYARS